ncbi:MULTISPECIES: cold-shock protein [unclassified Pseudomonas]|uniref:cold-shock protein n=1 Tax=unclassified Pseudomonas TaxID=196821 RepID=UPI000CD27CA6|nr:MULTISPECIES: cold-shock protein [unclassified Pseudomonas]POA23365.1 cold-shock protein [Pseudomonas sp. FW305-3-2-15-E-TSA4]POA32831.1 cold-shock protein [Pseudomonas sp. FW305-3-2-15-E-TSA2]
MSERNVNGVVKSFSEIGIVWGGPTQKFAIISPDDGSQDVAIEIGENLDWETGKKYLSVGDKVSYLVMDGPSGRELRGMLKKI